MNSIENKEIMSKNIKRFLDAKGITAKDLSEAIEIPYTTVCGWIQAATYPRIDKVEMLANYFGVNKAELVEEKQLATKTNTSTEKEKLSKMFDSMNLQGQQAAVAMISGLASNPAYRKQDELARQKTTPTKISTVTITTNNVCGGSTQNIKL